jgi:diguanylate cyclase (GGDEF)-like protein
LGGEEFVIIIEGLEMTALQHFAESVREDIAACRYGLEPGGGVTVSIGVAQTTGHPDFRALYRLADKALYAAKRSGRNRVSFSSAHNDEGDGRSADTGLGERHPLRGGA